jgi:hypothetical protein
VPAGAVSSNGVMLLLVSLHSSLSTANRPRDTSRPVNTTTPMTWTQVTLADFSLGRAMSRSTV